MRVFLALVSILVFIQPHTAAAVFYNNSDVIEIGDGSPDDPSAPSSGLDTGGTGGDSGGGAQTAPGTTGGSGSGSSDTSGSGSGTSDPSSGSNGSDSGSSSTGGSGGSSGSGGTESDIIQLLISGGALTGAGSDSSQSGSESAGSASDGAAGTSESAAGSATRGSGAAGGGSASMSVRIVASKVRDALKDNVDLKTLLQYWKRAPRAGGFTADEYGLIAASTALRDSNVQEVTFTASKFEIVYRSRGYLIGLFPWSFPVRVAIVPDASSATDRVSITLPWYRFFVRKFFTDDSLMADIDAVISKTKKENTDPDAGTAIVFDAVSQFLKTKVGTVGDSVILGVPAS